LIASADAVVEIEAASDLFVSAEVKNIDFKAIMERTRTVIRRGVDYNRQWIGEEQNLDFYESEGRFTGDYTLDLKGQIIKGKQIFIASGARPMIPPLTGLNGIKYLTNENVIDLNKKPESMVIIGGGYIACEYGHFFSALGTRITIIEIADRLVAHEEPEVSDLLAKALSRRMAVYTSSKAEAVRKVNGGRIAVSVRGSDGKEQEITAEKLLLAVGRVSNADSLDLDKTGVETDKKGFVKVDDYLQTTKPNIWAVGDATGRQMFTHAADREVEIAWNNATEENKFRMPFSLVPHAVYTHPKIASVGLTEQQARSRYDVLVGRATYSDTVQGEARMIEEGFAKAIVERSNGRIVGFHIIGPDAPILIQEVVNAMIGRNDIETIRESIHIFPALSELVPNAFENLK
jgi:dihydrolipoamide dehydrogenase